MKIVVLVKEVPDTYAPRELSLATGLADRGASEGVLDEITERALEVALAHADAHEETEVIALSMAPAAASATVRKALAMGATSAVQVVDDDLLGADLGLTAEALAAALRHVGFDLVIAGDQSTDGAGGVLPSMIAEILDVPALTYLSTLQIDENAVSGTRSADHRSVRMEASLPAVVSVTEAFPEARFPNFKGIMAAKKKPLETLSLADLGIEPLDPAASRSIMIAVSKNQPRQGGIQIVDDGDAGLKLAEYLVENRLA